MKKIFFATIAFLFLYSCSSTKYSSKKSNQIEVAIDLNNVVDDKIKVEINPKKINSTTVIYNIPAIVPGTYKMSDYGKFISNFKAYDYEGNELNVQKINTNSWKINNASMMDKISYWVDDTFDTKKKHSIYVMAGTNFEEGKNFLLNLPGLIGYFQNKKEYPYSISVSHPKNLYETSSLINSNTTKKDNTKDVFFAPRYDEISDNPIMYSEPNSISFTVNGIEVNCAVYSPNKIHSALDIKDDLYTMMKAQSNFLKGFKTTKEYNILVYLFDKNIYPFKGFGALEHNTSTTVVYPEDFTKKQLKNNMINGTVSHEFFHIVTPLTVHSEEIHSFDFNKPNMSQHLWMYEGITEYFSELFQVNQGLISEEDFVKAIKRKITFSKKYYIDNMSFTKMSKNILEKKYARNYGNVYQKGALIGMCLDIILREESKGKYGLRDLMKDLSKKYGKHKPFKDNEIINTITKMTYPAIGKFFKTHVEGNTPIDYNMYFQKAGIDLENLKIQNLSPNNPKVKLRNAWMKG